MTFFRFSLVMAGVSFLLGVGGVSAGTVSYVQADYTADAGTQQYDLANETVKFFTPYGMLEYPLSALVRIRRDAGKEVCELETIHGDRLTGTLITQSLKYYYFNTEKWLNVTEDQPFRLDIQQATPAAFDVRGFARLTAVDGGVLSVNPGTQAIRILLDDEQHDIPLSALGQAIFTKSVGEDEADQVEGCLTFGFGASVTVRVLSGNLSLLDSFGSKIECSLSDLQRYEGVGRDFVRSSDCSKTNAAWLQAELEMLDGRREKAFFPFSLFKLSRRSDGTYLLPLPVIKAITLEGSGEVVAETVFGDRIRGNPERNTVTIVPPGRDVEPIRLKLRNLAQIRFLPKEESGGLQNILYLETEEGRLAGIPLSGGLRMIDRESGDPCRVVAEELAAISPIQGDDYAVIFNDGFRRRLSPSDKTLTWLTYCDGQSHEIRWRALRGIVRPGYESEAEGAGGMQTSDDSATVQRGEENTDSAGGAATSDPRMKAGHVLQIAVLVSGEKEIDEPFRRISSRGELALPLLGSIPVSGLSLDELSALLTEKYRSYFREPQLVVQYVVDEESDSASPWGYVTVLGKVKQPGKVDIPPTQDLTVSMAVQRAGGFDTSAKDTAIRVTRPLGSDGDAEQIDINLRSVGARGEVQNDMILRPGDIVYVPEMIF